MLFDKANDWFWLIIRQGLLLIVDAVERGLKLSPTTSEIRAMYKEGKFNKG